MLLRYCKEPIVYFVLAFALLFMTCFPSQSFAQMNSSLNWNYNTGLDGAKSHMFMGSDGTVYYNHNVYSVSQQLYIDTLYAIGANGMTRWQKTLNSSFSPMRGPDGNVYMTHFDTNDNMSKLYAIRNDGTTKWTFPIANARSLLDLKFAQDGTVFATIYSTLFAINSSNGTKKWELAGPPNGNIEDIIIGPNGQISLTAKDTERYYIKLLYGDGSQRMGMGGGGIYYTPLYGQDAKVFLPVRDGQNQVSIYMIGLDNAFPPPKIVSVPGDYANLRLGSDGTVYMAVTDWGQDSGSLYAISANGTVKWSMQAEEGPFVTWGNDGTLYAVATNWTTDRGTIYALNPANGSVRWSLQRDGAMPPPAIGQDGTVYLTPGDYNQGKGSLIAVNPNTGATKWQLDSDTYFSPVFGTDGSLYATKYDAASNKSYLYKINASGTRLKLHEVTGKLNGYPSRSSDGTLYAFDMNGRVYSVHSVPYLDQSSDGIIDLKDLTLFSKSKDRMRRDAALNYSRVAMPPAPISPTGPPPVVVPPSGTGVGSPPVPVSSTEVVQIEPNKSVVIDIGIDRAEIMEFTDWYSVPMTVISH